MGDPLNAIDWLELLAGPLVAAGLFARCKKPQAARKKSKREQKVKGRKSMNNIYILLLLLLIVFLHLPPRARVYDAYTRVRARPGAKRQKVPKQSDHVAAPAARVRPRAIVSRRGVPVAKNAQRTRHGPTRADGRRMRADIASDRYFQAALPGEAGGNGRLVGHSLFWLVRKLSYV